MRYDMQIYKQVEDSSTSGYSYKLLVEAPDYLDMDPHIYQTIEPTVTITSAHFTGKSKHKKYRGICKHYLRMIRKRKGY